jgi:hypothetical protein
MSPWTGVITLAAIFLANNNWKRYLAWKGGQVRRAVFRHVWRMLSCRTPKLGLHLFLCDRCGTVKVLEWNNRAIAFYESLVCLATSLARN